MVSLRASLEYGMRLYKFWPGESWVNEDPLTISATQLRVHQLCEAALCPSTDHRQGCVCATMQRQYGSRLFKCNRFGCPYFRTGFEARSERDRHLRVHNRPYKCDRPNCDFSDMGFGSQARLNVHLQYHEKQAKKPAAHLANVDNEEDVKLIIFDAVKADDVDLVRDFIADVPRFSKQLLRQAVVSSSCGVLDVLLEACSSEEIIRSTVLEYAVRANNLEATRILLNWGASLKYSLMEVPNFDIMDIAMTTFSPEMIKLLLSHRYIHQRILRNEWINPVFDLSLRSNLERSKVARYIQCLSLLPDWTDKRAAFEKCFVSNAQGPCSIAIAEFLLRNGVDINHRAKNRNTALFYASNKPTKTAAEFMKFLLESGADPLVPLTPNCRPLADQPGPRKISKWLGVSWEQLVEESRKKYAASLEMKPQ